MFQHGSAKSCRTNLSYKKLKVLCLLCLLALMPINIAYKWWEHYKKFGSNRKYRQPFFLGNGSKSSKIPKFPSICKGVIIEKVMKGFSAEMAGLCVNDVIIECGGKTIYSFLEFFEIIWDKVGDLVELRQNNVKPIHLQMLVLDATPNKFNRWPGDEDCGRD